MRLYVICQTESCGESERIFFVQIKDPQTLNVIAERNCTFKNMLG
jgi:hypothetical protein